MNKGVLGVGIGLTALVVIFLAIGLTHDPRSIDSPLVGQPAPPFSLVDIDGQPVRLADLEGRPVVLNFWATWCQPCIAEHPIFESAGRRYGDRVVFLGVIYQDEVDAIRQFVRRHGAWGRTLIDADSKVSIAYGVYGVPETYLIAPDGTVAEKITGPVDPRTFFDKLEALL